MPKSDEIVGVSAQVVAVIAVLISVEAPETLLPLPLHQVAVVIIARVLGCVLRLEPFVGREEVARVMERQTPVTRAEASLWQCLERVREPVQHVILIAERSLIQRLLLKWHVVESIVVLVHEFVEVNGQRRRALVVGKVRVLVQHIVTRQAHQVVVLVQNRRRTLDRCLMLKWAQNRASQRARLEARRLRNGTAQLDEILWLGHGNVFNFELISEARARILIGQAHQILLLSYIGRQLLHVATRRP